MIWIDVEACMWGTQNKVLGTKHKEWKEQETKNCRTQFIDWYITLDARNDMHRKMYIKQN